MGGEDKPLKVLCELFGVDRRAARGQVIVVTPHIVRRCSVGSIGKAGVAEKPRGRPITLYFFPGSFTGAGHQVSSLDGAAQLLM